jgi:hypothetical protein
MTIEDKDQARRLQRLAERLSTVPDCPRSEGAIEALAEDLIELCDDEGEATQLVARARRWEKWRGTRGLIDLLETMRPALPAGNQAIDYGPKPVPDCAACQDWGHFTRNGRDEWCTCTAAEELRLAHPDWIDQMNRTGAATLLHNPVPIDRKKPLTEEDLEQACEQRRNRTDELIQNARATLDDPHASKDRKEMAREILRGCGEAS